MPSATRNIYLSPFLRDVTTSTITTALTLLSSLIVMRVLALGLGPEQFGAYSLARTFVSLMMPFATVAMGICVTRYVAIAKEENSKLTYFLSGSAVILAVSAVLLTVGTIFNQDLASLIFHNKEYSALLIASLIMVAGYAIYSVLYAFYRGKVQIIKANLLQLTVMAAAPLAIAVWGAKQKDAQYIVLMMGTAGMLCLIPLIIHALRALAGNPAPEMIKRSARELLAYGLPRIPGGFLFIGILGAGPFLAQRFISIRDVGYLVAGQALFKITETTMEAFAIVALPKMAQFVSEGNKRFLQERIGEIISLVFQIGSFVTIQAILWTDTIITVWFGPKYAQAIPVMRILLLSFVPYFAFILLRSAVDAIQEKAINTFNIAAAFAITFVFSCLSILGGYGLPGLAAATSLGFATLGILTVIYLHRVYGFERWGLKTGPVILLNALFLGLAFSAKTVCVARLKGMPLLSSACAIEACFLILYCLALLRLKASWLTQLKIRLIK